MLPCKLLFVQNVVSDKKIFVTHHTRRGRTCCQHSGTEAFFRPVVCVLRKKQPVFGILLARRWRYLNTFFNDIRYFYFKMTVFRYLMTRKSNISCKQHTWITGLWTQELALNTGHWTLDDGPWTMDSGHWTLDCERSDCLRLYPGARGEHLTSQLLWVTAWILATSDCPVHLVDELVLVFYASLWLG